MSTTLTITTTITEYQAIAMSLSAFPSGAVTCLSLSNAKAGDRRGVIMEKKEVEDREVVKSVTPLRGNCGSGRDGKDGRDVRNARNTCQRRDSSSRTSSESSASAVTIVYSPQRRRSTSRQSPRPDIKDEIDITSAQIVPEFAHLRKALEQNPTRSRSPGNTACAADGDNRPESTASYLYKLSSEFSSLEDLRPFSVVRTGWKPRQSSTVERAAAIDDDDVDGLVSVLPEQVDKSQTKAGQPRSQSCAISTISKRDANIVDYFMGERRVREGKLERRGCWEGCGVM